jgi:hypothetical protein
MERARLRPDKLHGVEHHIFDQAAETPVRPLRHLFFTSTDLVSVSGLAPGVLSRHQLTISSLHNLGVQRRDLDAAPPNDPYQLGGERDDHHIGMSSDEQLAYPSADSRRCLGKMRQSGAGAVDQLDSQVFVAPLADPEELRLAANRVLSRRQSEPCRQIASLGEGRANIILLRIEGLGVEAVAERLSTTSKRVSL